MAARPPPPVSREGGATMLTRFGRTGRIPALAALLALVVALEPVAAAASWTSAVRVSPTYSFGRHQGMLVDRLYLSDFAIYTVYTRVDTTFQGVYFRRGTTSGQSWGVARRVNPTTEHGDGPVIGAVGRRILVAWRTLEGVGADYDPAAPRGVKLRVNGRYGDSETWESTVTYDTPPRVGRISGVTRAGPFLVLPLVYTDADTGDIVYHPDSTRSMVIGSTTAGGSTSD